MDRNLRVLGIGSGLRSFGLCFVGPFAALYLYRVLGLGFLEIGLLLAAISVPPILVSPLGGVLTDRAGRRSVFALSLVGEAGALVISAAGISVGSPAAFVAGLAVSGILASLGGPALSAYVADIAHGSDRTMGFTWLRVGTNIGFAVGVAVGGLVVGALGFLAGAEVAAVVLAIGGLLAYGLLDPSPYDLGLRRPVPASGAGPRGGTRGWAGRLLGDRLFLLASLAFALATLVNAQWNTTYALFAGTTLGLPYAVIGAGFALNGVLVVLGQASTTSAVLGRRHTTIGIYGTLCYVGGFLLLGLAAHVGAAVVTVFLAATAIITVGENLVTIPTSTLPSNLAPPELIGTYNGVFGTVLGFGGLLATVLGGAALGSIHDPVLLWAVLMAPSLPAIALLGWVGRRLPDRTNRA